MQKIDVERLMTIAAAAFARHGFTGVGMREVSRECGVSLPTLYYYFGSKEKLFEAVCRDRYRKALLHVRSALDFDAPLETQIETLAGRLFDLLTGDQTLFLLLRRDLIEGSLSRREFHSRLHYEGMIDMLGRVLAKRFDETKSARLAFTAAALIFGYCEFVLLTREDANTEQRRRANLIDTLKTLLK
ncbi:MAG: TetR/AcrR family transcriptional regulator [Panacagrimonas sp.]